MCHSGNVTSDREPAEKALNETCWGSCFIQLRRYKEIVKPFKICTLDSQKKKALGKKLKFNL